MMEGANLMQSPLVKDLITCEVCSKLLNDPRVLPCQHSFCLKCLDQILQLRQADSHIRLGSLRCPNCRSIAAIPLGGLEHFPIDKKVEKIRDLVDELLIQSIISKSIKEDSGLSGSRSSVNSSSMPDECYGSRNSMYSSSCSISSQTNLPKACTQTQTDVSWEDLSQGIQKRENSCEEDDDGSPLLKQRASPRRRRRRPKPVAEEEMENELFITEEPVLSPKKHVNGMKDLKEPVEKEVEVEENHQDIIEEEDRKDESLTVDDENHTLSSQQNGEEQVEEEEIVEEEVETNDNQIYEEASEPIWEVPGLALQEYNMPKSIAFLSDKTTVVAEYGNSQLQFYKPDGTFEKAVEEIKPFCICVDSEDRILIGDRRNKTLCMFDREGEQIMCWDLDIFKWISGIGVTSDWKYVICEREKCKLGIYEPEGQLIKEFGSHGYNDTQFSMADFLVVDSHDRIILCDSANHCVKIFNMNGTFLKRFGHRGDRNGELEWPKGVCVDANDNILVTDKSNNRVSMFSPDGEFIQHIILDYPQPYGIAFQAGSPNLFGLTHYDFKGISTVSVFGLNNRGEVCNNDEVQTED